MPKSDAQHNAVRELRAGLSRLGVSRSAAAKHLGVAPQTLTQYGLDPSFAGARAIPETRLLALRSLYDETRNEFLTSLREEVTR